MESPGIARGIRVALAAFLCAVPGCARVDTHEGSRVVLDVRSAETGEPVTEWVAEHVLTQNTRWTWPEHAPGTVTETVLAVLSQNPSANTCELAPYTSGGIILGPGLGYGTTKWPGRTIVYATGYESVPLLSAYTRDAAEEPRHTSGTKPDGSYHVRRVLQVLRPWNNAQDHLNVQAFLLRLRDTRGFEPYEALRGTPQGTGVSKLYDYHVRRYEAIREANPGMPADPSVEKTLSWLRVRATGAAEAVVCQSDLC